MSAIEQSPRQESDPTSTVEDLILRFRPNLVVDGCDAFEEESWSNISIGCQKFEVSQPNLQHTHSSDSFCEPYESVSHNSL